MKKITLLSIFLLLHILAFAQEFKIAGQIVDSETLPLPFVYVGFDSTTFTLTDSLGNFELQIKESTLSDTLFINYIGHYNIKIINLHKEKDVNFGRINLYEYFYGYPIINFHCRIYHFKCKRDRKEFWENYYRERKNYFNKQDLLISSFKLELKGKQYPIHIKTHLINLKQ